MMSTHSRSECPCRDGHNMPRWRGEPTSACARCGIAVGKHVRQVPVGPPNAWESSPCPRCLTSTGTAITPAAGDVSCIEVDSETEEPGVVLLTVWDRDDDGLPLISAQLSEEERIALAGNLLRGVSLAVGGRPGLPEPPVGQVQDWTCSHRCDLPVRIVDDGGSEVEVECREAHKEWRPRPPHPITQAEADELLLKRGIDAPAIRRGGR